MEELKAYLFRSKKDKAGALVFGIILLLISVFAFVTKKGIIVSLITLIMAIIIIFWGVIFASKKDEKEVAKFLDKGAIEDFKRAKSFMNDRVRIGEKYIYRQKYSSILEIANIKKVMLSEEADVNNNSSRTVIRSVPKKGIDDYIADVFNGEEEEAKALVEMINVRLN